MALNAGDTLGTYKILGRLGAGAMGEVYRARDSKLNRDVALKLLPDAFTCDSERVARFQREAHLLASLNHPHIGAIYDFAEAPPAGPGQTATRFLVLELIDGDTLATRVEKGPLRLEETVSIARQIADALDAAHDKGIVHRDLKPANIALTTDGRVKVLDFGIAKQEAGVTGGSAANGLPGETHAPTVADVTVAGALVGTAAYMSPEQVQGRPADRRSDLWAYGCVLFEMLTGRRAFDAGSPAGTLAAILRDEPAWSALPTALPPNLSTLVRRCLEKDRGRRIAGASVALFLLNEPAVAGGDPTRRARSRGAAIASVAVAGLALAGLLWSLLLRVDPPRGVSRLHAAPPPGVAAAINSFDTDLDLSPDGRRLVFVGRNTAGSQTQLFVREIDRLDVTPLEGTAGARGAFFSPDGLWVAYAHGGDLKKSAVQGGRPIVICSGCAGGFRGGDWGPDDVIVFAAAGGATGLQRVAGSGGEPVAITMPDRSKGESHVTPEILPDGQTVLFTRLAGALTTAQIVARDLRTGTDTLLLRGGSHPRYLAGGYLVYASEGTLRAVTFEPGGVRVAGNPLPLVDGVVMKPTGAADFALSRDGSLVYLAGETGGHHTLAWIDRDGREEAIPAPPRNYTIVRLSPDGQLAALDIRDQDQDIWTWSFSLRTLSRLTFDRAVDSYPLWLPDGRRIAFATGGLSGNVFWKALAGTTAPEQLSSSANGLQPYAVSGDGKLLIVGEGHPRNQGDLSILPVEAPRDLRPLISTPFNEINADVSPDGRWMAYESNESGVNEVYVRPFPAVETDRWQVSMSGGTRPRWAPNGRELFYLGPDSRIMSVPVQSGASFSHGAAAAINSHVVFTPSPGRTYDVSGDGRRFLVIKEQAAAGLAPQIIVVLNWVEEVKVRVR